jgi:Asp-tRNA(Asn)/Glu-tRNA(Gln) amidotransferase A subunit family amidase
MDLIKVVTGPLTQTVDGAALWMKAMTDESFYAGKHDPYMKLIPFDEKLYNETFTSKKRLKIGYFDSLEMIEPAPSMIRGVA